MNILGRLIPSWVPLAIIAALLALLGVQQLRIEHAHTAIAEERQARAEENTTRERIAREAEAANNRTALARFNQAQEATNAARTRETILRADADGARTELGRLRDAIGIATGRRDLPGKPGAAQPDAAVAVGQLLEQCSAEVQELAGVADRHANDVQTLMASWPK